MLVNIHFQKWSKVTVTDYNKQVKVKSRGRRCLHGKGVCKTRTGYLRMADADGKMRMEKNADNKKSKKEKNEKCG